MRMSVLLLFQFQTRLVLNIEMCNPAPLVHRWSLVDPMMEVVTTVRTAFKEEDELECKEYLFIDID